MASFERERNLVKHLLNRLNFGSPLLSDPKADGSETGMDVVIRLADDRTIGIQVTEIDPHPEPGKARAEEKKISAKHTNNVYGTWGQNDSKVILDSLDRSITRKTTIARIHSFSDVSEVWLLICAGIPEHGAAVSTFVMTPWLSADDMNERTDNVLKLSKYSRCFFLPILSAEQAIYSWDNEFGWTKSVRPEGVHEVPNLEYIDSLHRAAISNDWQEVDRLCDEECKKVLSEMRES